MPRFARARLDRQHQHALMVQEAPPIRTVLEPVHRHLQPHIACTMRRSSASQLRRTLHSRHNNRCVAGQAAEATACLARSAQPLPHHNHSRATIHRPAARLGKQHNRPRSVLETEPQSITRHKTPLIMHFDLAHPSCRCWRRAQQLCARAHIGPHRLPTERTAHDGVQPSSDHTNTCATPWASTARLDTHKVRRSAVHILHTVLRVPLAVVAHLDRRIHRTTRRHAVRAIPSRVCWHCAANAARRLPLRSDRNQPAEPACKLSAVHKVRAEHRQHPTANQVTTCRHDPRHQATRPIDEPHPRPAPLSAVAAHLHRHHSRPRARPRRDAQQNTR